MPPKAVMII